jgi:uncharacterized pyridoxal phosphate-containing UPF0001 family protein
LERIDRLAGEAGRCPNILLQVNITGEDSKSGMSASEVPAVLTAATACANLRCRGFMTMAEFGADEAALHACFGGLHDLRDRMVERFGVELPELSMGMSGDFAAAIADGATLVRIGTAIFGARS